MRHQSVENELDLRVSENMGNVILARVGGAPPAASDDRSFALVEKRLARRVLRIRRWSAAAVMAAVTVAGGATFWRRNQGMDGDDQRITYEVGRGLAVRNGDLVASRLDAGLADVRFSDGTLVRMEPRTRGRVVRVDGDGAQIVLYDGKAHVAVRHRAKARWLFDAGPFQVRVHGTAFSIAWSAAEARFDLQMESGVVSVAGPFSGGEITLGAGQRLSVALGDAHRGAEVTAAVAASPSATDSPNANANTFAATHAGEPAPMARAFEPLRNPSGHTVAPSAGRVRVVKEWRTELAEGHANAIVADARRRGLDHVLATADSENLAALGDAARYVGSDDLARRVLHTQRQRFPGSKRAAEASFMLGRLEDESPAGATRALGWYDRYLMEAPSGAYASEALGREMMVLERAGRHEEAVAIARTYLDRFATGSYAHAADVLVAPSPLTPASSRKR